MNENHGIPFSSPDERVNYLEIAKDIVFQVIKKELAELDRHGTFEKDEVYVVWFSKTLQNFKALLSTSLPDGRYYELTYNGDKREAYLDTYVKLANQVVQLKDHRL